MEKLKKIAEYWAGLELNPFMQIIFADQDVQEEVIRLNTDEQLFEEGKDSEGRSLEDIGGEYAPFTVMVKQEEGLPFDRVTLFQTGDFYDSFLVRAGASEFIIEADPIKGGEDLRDRWGENIIGLSDESKEALVQLVKDELIQILQSESP